ncbi:flippase [Bacillus carboniphilus]|uniref:Flippase n=1 Tax=Bacillus carboniphilus TaxID=86663 RepID=A0ABY9K0T4_9BACI|nr:flippase [Bacillus carboniphilus]WLR44323.1 flippase [Bacillus carboniphilus]
MFTIANIFNASIPFLLLPVLTRYLSPEEFGVYSMFKVFVGLVFSVIGIGINGAITRMYYEKDDIDFPSYIGNSVILVTISTTIIFLLFAVAPDFISSISSLPNSWIWLIIVTSYGKVLFQLILVVWQVKFRPISFGLFQVSQTVINFAISLVFVISLYMGWKGPILAEAISFGLFGLFSLLFLRKNKSLSFNLNKQYMKHALKFGIPLIPHVLGMYIITASDRFFINNMVGVYEVGIYATGYQVGMILMILQDSFNKAWVPWLFERLKENDFEFKRKIVKITYVYFVTILFIAFILSLLSPWLLSFLVGEEYRNASVYIAWLAFGYAFNGMYKMVTNYIFYVEKTIYLAYVTGVTAIINIGLNFLLIKMNGAVGASQATMIAYMISFILTWLISSRAFKMPWLPNKN